MIENFPSLVSSMSLNSVVECANQPLNCDLNPVRKLGDYAAGRPLTVSIVLEAVDSGEIDELELYQALCDRVNGHHYKYYRKDLSEAEMADMDRRLRDICGKKARAIEVADLLFGREYRHIFDQNYKISLVYRELHEHFGLQIKLNTLQGAVREVLYA